jgi:hypothetical protein
LQKKVPTLVNTHCVVHQKALTTSDALKVVLELLILQTNIILGWEKIATNKRN